MPLEIWVVAFIITVGAGTVQGTVGVGFAMVSVPILTLLNPQLTPAPQLLMALPLTISMAIRERNAADLSGVGWIIGARFPGALIGVFLLGFATQRVLDVFIGLVVLGAVIIIGTGYRIHRTTTTKIVAGVASGTTGVVSSIGGPPIALIYSQEEADTIRSTLAVVFTFGALTSTAFRWFSGNLTMMDLRVALVLLPAALGGLWLSTRYNDRIPKGVVQIGILIIIGSSAIALLVRAILG